MKKYLFFLSAIIFAFILFSCDQPVEEDPINYIVVTFDSNGDGHLYSFDLGDDTGTELR